MAGMKKLNDHAELKKSRTLKKLKNYRRSPALVVLLLDNV